MQDTATQTGLYVPPFFCEVWLWNESRFTCYFCLCFICLLLLAPRGTLHVFFCSSREHSSWTL